MTALVDELTEKNPTMKRVQFAMKKNQAAKLKDSLREVRMKLHDILVAHNVYVRHRKSDPSNSLNSC